jgi:dihydroneopterin aldolase
VATLFINELKIPAVIGIHTWEKKIKQTLVFDLEIETDISKAANSDDINDAIDYVQICELMQSFLQDNSFNLIETLADKIANLLLQNFSLTSLRLVVRKPKVLSQIKEVGIVIIKSSK